LSHRFSESEAFFKDMNGLDLVVGRGMGGWYRGPYWAHGLFYNGEWQWSANHFGILGFVLRGGVLLLAFMASFVIPIFLPKPHGWYENEYNLAALVLAPVLIVNVLVNPILFLPDAFFNLLITGFCLARFSTPVMDPNLWRGARAPGIDQLRLLIVMSAAFPGRSPIANHMQRMARGLRECGHSVQIVAPRNPNDGIAVRGEDKYGTPYRSFNTPPKPRFFPFYPHWSRAIRPGAVRRRRGPRGIRETSRHDPDWGNVVCIRRPAQILPGSRNSRAGISDRMVSTVLGERGGIELVRSMDATSRYLSKLRWNRRDLPLLGRVCVAARYSRDGCAFVQQVWRR